MGGVGDAMDRVPTGGDVEDAVEVVGHDDESVEGNVGVVCRQCSPSFFRKRANLR